MKPLIFIILAALMAPVALTSRAQCSVNNTAFGAGEEVAYTVSYNWGPVWVDAGTVTFTAKNDTYGGKPAMHLKAVGKTFPSYDLLFKVRDYYDAWIDPAEFRTHEFRRYIYEGGYTLLNTIRYDHSQKIAVSNTKSNNNPQRTDTLRIRNCSFDMLTAIYYVRTLDFGKMLTGTKHQVSVLIDDAYYDIYIRALGRETVEAADGKRYRCIKGAAKMVQFTIFKGDEDVLVWVTDDANKIPVYVEAKIIVGTIKAYLKTARGTRAPLASVNP